ncbi:DUF3560 domain-containing protein [Streptomyces coryli]|uniref:DUF3560 domain-containing protein n=1 Tax=Streptomyces coryli TaxID=1128680 RepID=UPI001F1098D2|nr:DUF3560 domain-containing protein [Streptomyces coryli]
MQMITTPAENATPQTQETAPEGTPDNARRFIGAGDKGRSYVTGTGDRMRIESTDGQLAFTLRTVPDDGNPDAVEAFGERARQFAAEVHKRADAPARWKANKVKMWPGKAPRFRAFEPTDYAPGTMLVWTVAGVRYTGQVWANRVRSGAWNGDRGDCSAVIVATVDGRRARRDEAVCVPFVHGSRRTHPYAYVATQNGNADVSVISPECAADGLFDVVTPEVEPVDAWEAEGGYVPGVDTPEPATTDQGTPVDVDQGDQGDADADAEAPAGKPCHSCGTADTVHGVECSLCGRVDIMAAMAGPAEHCPAWSEGCCPTCFEERPAEVWELHPGYRLQCTTCLDGHSRWGDQVKGIRWREYATLRRVLAWVDEPGKPAYATRYADDDQADEAEAEPAANATGSSVSAPAAPEKAPAAEVMPVDQATPAGRGECAAANTCGGFGVLLWDLPGRAPRCAECAAGIMGHSPAELRAHTLPADVADAEEEAQAADIVILHTHEDGTTVEGSSKGDGVWEALRPLGWTYRRTPGIFIRGSRYKGADRWKINRAADAVRALGLSCAVVIEETMSFAEREAARVDVAEARSERYGERAGRAAARSEGAWQASHGIADHMTGEPIKVGHHSERRHRRDIERMDSHMRRAITEDKKAGYWASRAQAAEAYERYRKNPGRTLRRIEKLEAERRSILRERDGVDDKGRKADVWRREPSEARREELTRRLAEKDEELTYWAETIKEAERHGFKIWGRADFVKGDYVRYRGTWYEVTRVNAKSVTIPHIHAAFDGGAVGAIDGCRVVTRAAAQAAGRMGVHTYTAAYNDGVDGRMSAEQMRAALAVRQSRPRRSTHQPRRRPQTTRPMLRRPLPRNPRHLAKRERTSARRALRRRRRERRPQRRTRPGSPWQQPPGPRPPSNRPRPRTPRCGRRPRRGNDGTLPQ